MAKRTFPVVVNKDCEDGLNHYAESTVKRFNTEIFPLLLKFGLLDDKHIEKYLACDTTEAIYKDALAENPSSIYALEQEALIEEMKENPKEKRDVWRIFRGAITEAKSPKEEGFIFSPIPGADCRNRVAILKALSVKNLQFSIDREYLKKASIVHPTEKQVELFNMLSDFCEAYNKKNFHKWKPINCVLYGDANGIHPSVHSILGLTYLYEIKNG
jgi:hypothetical protein